MLKRIQSRTRTPLHFKLFGKSNIRVDSYSIIRARYNIYILQGPLQQYLHIPGPTPAIFTYSRAHCTLQTYLHIPGPTPVIFTYLMWEVWRKLLGWWQKMEKMVKYVFNCFKSIYSFILYSFIYLYIKDLRSYCIFVCYLGKRLDKISWINFREPMGTLGVT